MTVADGASFTVRPARPEEDAAIASLVVEGFLDKFHPTFGRKMDRSIRIMEDWVRLERTCAGACSLVIDSGTEIAATLGIREHGADDLALSRELWRSLRRHLGLLYAWRAALLLSYPRHEIRPSEAYVERLVVAPAYRRSGMARTLLRAAQDWGRENGKDTLGLQVSGNNFPALRLYESLGFRETSRQRSLITGVALGIREWLYLEKPV
ncbi:GNAT family N-acetyltransferase [Rubrobacter taiwanensis]|jgi:GNAT superfamily N-acetyltransferase|uniref:GNAT family N-acetyltransferase n=1 Tax=Rubrobacter taiwanensis TaxID=185139 RepID=A0A4R1BJB9_9ACTN|nr:GNAT family N-acetyltransferase [Rubrobacter taiwanensis]TCJ17384.1 GNAT family N-acetyltransferase [Rubrobacter taiwanensis]